MTTLEFLRQFRVAGYAVFDFAASFLGVYALSPLLSKLFSSLRVEIPRKSWLFFTLPLSVLAHLLAGRMTPMTKNLLDIQGNYVLKLLILILVILGLQGIKITKRAAKK